MSIANAAHGSMMGGKRKPYRAELEYIESTGTQYILLSGANYKGIDIKILPALIGSVVHGSAGRWNGGSRADTIRNQTVQNRCISVTNGDNSSPVYSGINPGARLVDISVRGTNVTIDGSSYQMGRTWSNYDPFKTAPFTLFGCYNAHTGLVTGQASKIGACKLYTGNEHTLKYDLIPVLDWDGEAKMFDRVTGTYPAHYGTFIPGPII